jgi:hypothetical protein
LNIHENQPNNVSSTTEKAFEERVVELRDYLEELIEERTRGLVPSQQSGPPRDDQLTQVDTNRECWSDLSDPFLPPRDRRGDLFHCSFDETIYTFSADEDHDMTVWEAQQVARTADAIKLLVSGEGDWAIEHLQALLDKGEPVDWILLAGADMAFDAPTTNRRPS